MHKNQNENQLSQLIEILVVRLEICGIIQNENVPGNLD